MQNGVKVFLINTLSVISIYAYFSFGSVCVWGGGGNYKTHPLSKEM